MLMSLWYTQFDRVLVAAATRISPVTFQFSSNDESDHDKKLLWLSWKPYCRQILQILWHCRCDCLPWIKSSWPDSVLSYTVSVSCEFCSEMPPSFRCACSDAQLCIVGLGWLETSRRPAKVDGKTHSCYLWCTCVFLAINRCIFSSKAFCTVSWDLTVVLSLYLQLSVIGFLLLACFCLLI